MHAPLLSAHPRRPHLPGPQWWLELAIGLAVPLGLDRTLPERARGAGAAALVAAALFGSYLLYDSAMVA
ncbi:hypothetical protein [Glaciibacter psychrotolerans]|uniref:Uncharacterized protein n=1 Tax=Glaciibacter psychrotolerans TaxID=670054 RepID=A0A7Z0EC04_9MICO|nr:hypothetical protein [Leifsonia psychrotolerans]NYJ18733.1 hypothetical protein [Leifsonia psychrotolerans]